MAQAKGCVDSSVLGTAAVAAGTITWLCREGGTSVRMPIPGEVTLALFLVAGILLMVYVYRRASRAIETEIRLAAARLTLWFIKNGVIGRPSADESDLAYELRVTIECVRFGMKAIEQSAVPLDQVARTRFILQETLDSLETTRQILQRGSPFG